ncbi:hypothetical protein P9239_22390 [Caballeronia sp. LZ062]|uniref:hypothetical protein n=1 Tax=unclassified Caballeronia TaxID=2646786 RepID=UPI002859B5F1|nr:MULTISPECIES: hypothetical protein [unclassified Caballeronia]MDR5856434.1 hypothetical protein [Caballeronia sp. LZ050]MDR5873104.1 hypothetical protein [Caballeronia sp. LZ062]
MNYLTIIAAVWAVCALFAVLFIRGATLRDRKPVPVQSSTRRAAASAVKDASRAA